MHRTLLSCTRSLLRHICRPRAIPRSAPASPIRRYYTFSAASSIALSSASFSYLCYQWFKPPPLLKVCSAEPMHSNSPTVAELSDESGLIGMHAKSTQELVLAYVTYKLCTIPGFVDLASSLIHTAQVLHLQRSVFWLIKRTVFRQFCGGETPEECRASMQRLAQSGIHCILDLSIEADLQEQQQDEERRADVVLAMIKDCLKTAASNHPSFAAIKVTAFAPPGLLLRINQILVQLDQAFDAWKTADTIDNQGLRQIVKYVLPAPRNEEQAKARETLLSKYNDNNALDRLEVHKLFDLQGPDRDVWWMTDPDLSQDSTPLTTLELQAYDRMVQRLDQVCQMARDLQVGVMVDAEQSYFQEAIDHVATNLQQKYNRLEDKKHGPTVYNTYQMCTKMARRKLERDVERAKRENFAFAAKLVRGAYLVMERKRAAQLGYPSPIHDTLQDTHDSYNNSIRFLLGKLHEYHDVTGQALELATSPIVFMVASHNRDSIILTVQKMQKHQVSPSSGVVQFGQLYGMQDQISYALGKNGYPIFKYLPYGKIEEVMPYLLRRAQENSSMMGGASKECRLIWLELKQRWWRPSSSSRGEKDVGFRSPSTTTK